jgi:hypothetical protein
MIDPSIPTIINQTKGDGWWLANGDSAEVLPHLPDRSVHLSIFSPPFSSTYTYSPSERDLGNVPDSVIPDLRAEAVRL